MQKVLLLILVLLGLPQLSVANESKPLSSKIEEVTIFLNGAQVTRTASTSLIAGVSNLVFKDIPANINVQSI